MLYNNKQFMNILTNTENSFTKSTVFQIVLFSYKVSQKHKSVIHSGMEIIREFIEKDKK